jgi:antitoxin component HigA of HigAB toxin-antitoxin module
MLKITAKDIAALIGHSPEYTRVLLSRRKIKVKPGALPAIIELIIQYKAKNAGVKEIV